jgi:hypothetical protein
MFWLMLLALMILIPVVVAVLTWHETRQGGQAEAAPSATPYTADLPADAAVAHGSSNA